MKSLKCLSHAAFVQVPSSVIQCKEMYKYSLSKFCDRVAQL